MGKSNSLDYTIPAELTCPKCGSHAGLRNPTFNEAQLLIEGTLDYWPVFRRLLLTVGRDFLMKGPYATWKDLDRHETMRNYAILMCDSCHNYLIVCPGCQKPAIVYSRPLNEHLAYFSHFCREESH